MATLWGVLILLLALLAWGGQTLALFAPRTAERFGLTDRPDEVDPVFYADVRGEAAWDFLSLWTLGVAGVLLIGGASSWAYFGLIGGAIYVYFAGRGILVRREMLSRGQRIGDAAAVKTAFVALAIWGIAGLITLITAWAELA